MGGRFSPAFFYAMSIRLSPRLQAVADCVPPGARVIDVGTDHGMIPVWLAQNGAASRISASDVRPGPLESAASLLRRTGLSERVELRLTDGLQGWGPEDGDTVILAGMGGETMVSILEAAPWVKEGVLLILEPQTKQADLRRFLQDSGYAVLSECLVRDAGRIYPVLTARAGASAGCSEAELHTGRFEQIAGDPLFGEYLASLIRRAGTAAPHDDKAQQLWNELKEMERRLSDAQSV